MWKHFPSDQGYEYPPEAAGTGSGGTLGGGDAGGAGGSGVGAVGGSTGGTPYRLTDDSLIVGDDGKPVKYGEYRNARYMPKDEYQRGVDFLMKVADGFDKAQPKGRQPQPQPQPQPRQPAKDPFEGLDDLPVVDGRTLAKLGRQLAQEGMAPLGQAMTQIAAKMKVMEDRLAKAEGLSGSLAERDSSRDFEDHITKTVSAIPEIKGLGTVDATDPAVREIMKDIWLSHDQKDPNLLREYPKMAAERLEALFKYFVKKQSENVKAAKEKSRSFFDPTKGRGTPTGAEAYTHRTGSDIAAMARESGLWDTRHAT